MNYTAGLVIGADFVEAVAQRVAELLAPLLLSVTQKGDEGNDKYLTISQLAEYSGISKSWLYSNYKKAGIPHHYKNDPPLKKESPLFKKSHFDQWLRDRNSQQEPKREEGEKSARGESRQGAAKASRLKVAQREFKHQRAKATASQEGKLSTENGINNQTVTIDCARKCANDFFS